MALVGILFVFAAIAGGFAMAGGHFGVLIQPSEFVVILGAGIGALITSSPGKMKKRVLAAFKMAVKENIPSQKDYLDLLKLQYELFMLARRQGVLALETHVNDPAKSDLFNKYPSIKTQHHARTFLAEALQQIVNGIAPDELEQLLDSELDTLKAEGHLATGLIKVIGDALPGIGIVAAVLGIVKTMGAISEPPEILGLMIGKALVGTFLGVFLAYGIVGPMASRLNSVVEHDSQFYKIIRDVLVAHLHGNAAQVSVEIGRGSVPSSMQPSFAQLEEALATAAEG